MAAGLAAGLAGCGGDGAEDTRRHPPPFTLMVAPRVPEPPQLRVRLARVEDAEAAQDRLARHPVATRSVLRSPFHALDVSVPGGDPAGVQRLGAALARDSALAGVDECPCPVQPIPEPTEFGVRRLARSCASSPSPRPVTGCVEEYERVQPRPGTRGGKEPENYYALSFHATARPADGSPVRRLKATVRTFGSARHFSVSPGADVVLPRGRPTLPFHVGGFEELDKQAQFSPGRVHPYPVARQLYHVSSFPAKGVTRGRVEGGVAGSVFVQEELEKEYKITVQYRSAR